MAPQHESDLPENRWKESEWKYYVLWEKIEQKLKNRKRWLFLVVLVIALGILAIPSIRDRQLKWKGVSLLRKTSFEIQKLQMESAKTQKPVLIHFLKVDHSLQIIGESVNSCSDYSNRLILSKKTIFTGNLVDQLEVLSESISLELGLSTLSNQFCYDPAVCQFFKTPLQTKTTFGLIPVKDLSEKRLDRISFLEIKGAETVLRFD